MNPETTLTTTPAASRRKVDQLFTLEKIAFKDIEGFTPAEREYLAQTCTKMLNKLKAEERDKFLHQAEHIISPITKSDIWEYNHAAINNAVSQYMAQYGVMPTKNDIADETGLSRQTVTKHFATHNHHPEFLATMEQFKFMAPTLLANVYKFALKGDTKAARLYLQMVGALNNKQAATLITSQNNYIQVNNTILSQENLKHLTPGQLNQIESIITNTPQKKLPEAAGSAIPSR